MNMKHTWTYIREETRSVLLLRIADFSVTSATIGNTADCIKSRCIVDGCDDWEIRFYPSRYHNVGFYLLGLELVFLGGSSVHTAALSGRLLDHDKRYRPCSSTSKTMTFRDPSDRALVYIASGDLRDFLLRPAPAPLSVECTISVFKDTKDILPLPSSDLHRHLGELLESKIGADVTFAVSGMSIAAHKNILAARSPVFMAEFFGAMAERSAQRVEIQDMEPAAFEAMLRFIYTDMEPELDTPDMAKHVLVAADRYGLDRLKMICEHRLFLGIDTETAAATLALAERHSCSGLKARCVEFIAGCSAENLDAVLATEGYRHLEASSPSVLTELLKAAVNGRKR